MNTFAMDEDPEFNISFVEIIKQYPILYDRFLPEYSNRNSVTKAWEQVAKEVNYSVDQCRTRWKNLRTCYVRQLRTKPTDGTSARARSRPYYLTKALSFLQQFSKTRKYSPNLKMAPHKMDIVVEVPVKSEQPSTHDEPSQNLFVSRSSSPQVPETLDEDDELSSEAASPAPQYIMEETAPLKQNVKNIARTYCASLVPAQSQEYNEDEDGFMSFVRSLLPDLRTFTPRQRRECKQAFLKIVCDIADRNETSDV